MIKLFFTLSVLLVASLNSTAQSWRRIVYGSPGSPQMLASCVDKYDNYYVAGTVCDSLGRARIYKWTGTEWDFSMPAITSSPYILSSVYALCTDSIGFLYAAGNFKNAGDGFVAKWNGTEWLALGFGNFGLKANGDILALATDKSGNIYAAGNFTNAQGYRYVAKWNGSEWSELGMGAAALKANAAIRSLFVDGFGNVYAGGAFSDDPVVNQGNVYVAKWNGYNWSKLGAGVCPSGGVMEIRSVLADNIGNVYAAGRLDSANVAKWNGSNWEVLGAGAPLHPNGDVFSLCFDRSGNVYAGGSFTDSAKHVNTNCYVAKWDGNTWSGLGAGAGRLYPNSWILSLCTDSEGELYAAGEFTKDGNGYVGRFGYSANNVKATMAQGTVLSVSPNPATGSFTIHCTEKGIVGKDFYLVDITGKVVKTGQMAAVDTHVDIRNIPAGTYVLKVRGSASAVTVTKE